MGFAGFRIVGAVRPDGAKVNRAPRPAAAKCSSG